MYNSELFSKNILILANTFIKNRNLDKWLFHLKEKLNQVKARYEIFIDNYPTSLNPYNELIILGGDGSINYIINKYQRIDIPISIIPLGTGNDLYGNLKNNVIDVKKSLEIAIHGTPSFIDAGKCNDQIFLNTFSVGFDAQATYDSIKFNKLILHRYKYIIATLKNILFYKADSYILDGITNKYSQLTFMNGPCYGNGIKISPNSNLYDGKMELILLPEITNILTKIQFLLKLRSGRHIYDKLLNIKEVHDKLVISCANNTKYQIDGECHNGNYFELKVLSKQYQFKS